MLARHYASLHGSMVLFKRADVNASARRSEIPCLVMNRVVRVRAYPGRVIAPRLIDALAETPGSQ